MKTMLRVATAAVVTLLAAAGGAEAADGWARSSGSLRAGPGSDYPAIDRVASGEAIDVHGCLRRWSWCDVSVDGERGWFPGDRIALLRDGRRVALPGAAAIVGLGILAFDRDVYWNDHYRDRPFYHSPRWDDRRTPPPHADRPASGGAGSAGAVPDRPAARPGAGDHSARPAAAERERPAPATRSRPPEHAPHAAPGGSEAPRPACTTPGCR